MASLGKLEDTTGNGTSKRQAEEGESTVAPLTVAQAADVLPFTRIVQMLSLLQTDLADLQQRGLRLVLTGTLAGRIGILIEWRGHKLDFREGGITVDGHPI